MYDDLWSTDHGKSAWIDNAPDDQREWLEGLADAVVEKGGEPTWSQVARTFHARFEVERPHTTTLRDTVRKLVKQRAG